MPSWNRTLLFISTSSLFIIQYLRESLTIVLITVYGSDNEVMSLAYANSYIQAFFVGTSLIPLFLYQDLAEVY